MKKIALLASLLIISTVVRAQQIKWAKDTLLTWNDFKGTPDSKIPHQAYTHCVVSYSFHCVRHNDVYTLTFAIKSGFDKNTSWCIDGKQTAPLLKHEQLHLDIHELYVRKLYASLSQYTYTGNYDEEAKAIFRRVLKEVQATQDLYDTESDHSRNKEKQLEWETKIRGQLDNTPLYPAS